MDGLGQNLGYSMRLLEGRLTSRMDELQAALDGLEGGEDLEGRIDDLQDALDALRAALVERMGELQAALDDSTATSEEKAADLERRMAELEAALDDAPTSRLMILPVNQAKDQQEEPQ